MFVQHKQLKVLNLPASKVARLKTSASNVQMAFPGYPPQVCSAYLVALAGGSKVLVMVGFYLTESKESIFFVPQQGEVLVEEIEQVFEEGFEFAESMGFILSDSDYHLLTSDDQEKLWAALPICRAEKEPVASKAEGAIPDGKAELTEDDLAAYRQRSLESLGRFLASL